MAVTIFEQLVARYDEVAGIESAMRESLNPSAAFLLVEEAPLGGYWLTTHDSLEAAGAYFADQEDGSWQAKQLVDLRTGETYSAGHHRDMEEGIMTLTWQSQDHGDEPRDQQADLHGPYWAEVGPDSRYPWSWGVMDADNAVVIEGYASTEEDAKAAVEQWALTSKKES